ncbi:polysaccharide biosynthesis tyrosine autokinase [Corynebacterium pseudopelargi]|uniref:non-specific protein-tyrosine kinase n=1 Tax=Corynebacterium pseudopelargi TaxID=2080757 RepID=A0A3G6IW93_9CORY|nr:polysaccharide biosynthesis tyrosine autokinase [Corynebacterium pseudopelargi]AZA08234.1 Tyrosine-protein kinase etk [Corynebacterium pseudopelargi]
MRELAMLAGALRRKWWVILLTAVVIAGLVGGWGTLRQQEYRASARLTVTMTGEASSASASYQNNLAAETRIASYVELVRSNLVLDRVSELTGIPVGQLRGMVNASDVKKTVLFDVSATAKSPETASQVARGLAEVYPEVIEELETPKWGPGGPPVVFDENGKAIPFRTGPQAFATIVSDNTQNPSVVPPTRTQMIALGLFVGIIAGLLMGILADLLDRRVRRPEEFITLAPGVPILGEVPQSRSRGEKKGVLLDFRSGHSASAEAMRAARTSMSFVGGDQESRVFLITSALPGEGKTFVSANISRAYSEAGSRVLVIGADLRSPKIGAAFDVPEDVGLSNVLAGQIEFEDVIFSGGDMEPDVIPAGPTPPNPSELLSSKRMQALLEWAREHYDITIIDTPPVDAVTDAVVLAPAADAVVLVARVNVVTRTALARTLENLSIANVTPSGVIVNSVRSGGGSGYGKYGYGYGYGNTKKSNSTDATKAAVAQNKVLAEAPQAGASAALKPQSERHPDTHEFPPVVDEQAPQPSESESGKDAEGRS